MAITRVFIDGFESGGMDLWDTCTMVIDSAITGRTGSYCAKGNATSMTKQITSAASIYIAFKYYFPAYAAADVVTFYNGATPLGVMRRLVGGTVDLCWTDSTHVAVAGTALLSVATWMLVEIYYLPHLTTGTFTMKINGVQYSTVTGAKTSPSTSNITAITFSHATASNAYFDDIIFDTAEWIGPTSIQGLVPTGAGATTGWTASTGSDYACVDELPAVDTDYIYTNTANVVDTFACGDLAGTINSIKAVQVQARVKYEGTCAVPKVQMVTRPVATDRVSASLTVPTFAAASVFNIWNTNPDDSAAWESADVNGMEIGVKAVAA